MASYVTRADYKRAVQSSSNGSRKSQKANDGQGASSHSMTLFDAFLKLSSNGWREELMIQYALPLIYNVKIVMWLANVADTRLSTSDTAEVRKRHLYLTLAYLTLACIATCRSLVAMQGIQKASLISARFLCSI